MSKFNHNNVNYEIKLEGIYNFYGDAVQVIRVSDGMVGFIFRTVGCLFENLYNECQIEEFAEQNPGVIIRS